RMSWLAAAVVVVAGTLASSALCARLIAWLRRAEVLDHPNPRSLHAVATPRGGGLAIAAVVLAVQAALALGTGLEHGVAGVLFACGAGFLLLGWADDRAPRPVRLRLLVQLMLAVAAVGALQAGVPSGTLAWLGAGALVVAVVWHVNLYNFMDGADGLAAIQAILAALGVAALLAVAGQPTLALWPLALAAASAGFLRWNWSPA